MNNGARRGLVGFAAGASSVLPFYQGLWTAIAETGLDWRPYPPGGVPLLLGLALAGGVVGAVLALVRRGWRGGLVAGGIGFVLLRIAATGEGDWVGILRSGTIVLSWGGCLGLALGLACKEELT